MRSIASRRTRSRDPAPTFLNQSSMGRANMQSGRRDLETLSALSDPPDPRAKRLELALRRERLLRAALGDGIGGVAGRLGERGVEAEAGGEIAGEAADEGVACA